MYYFEDLNKGLENFNDDKYLHAIEESGTDGLEKIDFQKLGSVFRKSIVWIVVILLITNTVAYLYIRYTKPVYESHSDLKLDVKSEANLLEFNTLKENQNLNNISGEIELIKSKLFFSKVIDAVDLNTTYYAEGKINDEERYKNSPFEVRGSLRNESFLDTPIKVEIINANQFQLKYSLGEEETVKTYRFGEKITNSYFDFRIFLTSNYDPLTGNASYYFIINSDRSLLDYLSTNLVVEPLNLNANTIRLSFSDYNRYKARDLVNAIDTLYLNYTQEEKNKANKQRIEFLDQQLSQTEVRLETYEDYIEDFTISNKSLNLKEDMGRTILMMEEIDSQKVALGKEIEYLSSLEKTLGSDQTLLVRMPEYLPNAEIVNSAIEELNTLLNERAILLSSYNQNTYAVARKNQAIDQVENSIKENISRYKDLAVRELERLKNRADILQESFESLPSKSTEFTKVQRNFSLYEEFLLSLMQSKAEFEIARAGTVTDFKILSSATLPTTPIYPNVLIIYGMGAVSGIILSLLFLGIRYLLHNKISSLPELESLSKAPVLGVVPYYTEKMKFSKLVIDKNPKSAMSESLRSIRTNMDFMNSKKDKKIIAVTSTVSGEGKTFISVNMGAIIAMSKQKVVIVDLDMRKPKVHQAFSEENSSKGVSTILIDRHRVSECVRKTTIAGLDYIPSGPTPPNPSELLLNDELDILLDLLKVDYDVIILDTPPVGLVTDGILVMRKSDISMYVIRADYSKKGFLKSVNKLVTVNRFQNLALVLNSLNHSQSYGYGYGYGNHYYEETTKQKSTFSALKSYFK